MNLSKTGLAIAISVLLASGGVFADSNDSNGSDDILSGNNLNSNQNNSVNDSGNGNLDDSGNTLTATDNSTNDSGNLDVEDSGNTLTATDNSTNDSGNLDVEDSGNTLTATDNSTNDSGNVDDSGNVLTNTENDNDSTWNNSNNRLSNNESYEITIESDTVIANATTLGSVAGATVVYGAGGNHGQVSVDNMNTMNGFGSAAGITTVAQNSGGNSLVQQSVAVNASVFTD
ncbi:hypothetical protein L4D20_06010 [Vibrio kyushuensis]|uniref:hypothetical protein n=1 Tax=Vibrio TaxID=662 RepID=UPI003D14F10A